jgi:hypothetical protein
MRCLSLRRVSAGIKSENLLESRVFARSAGIWVLDFSLLLSLWLGQAGAQDIIPAESKASHNYSSEVISKTSEKEKVLSKYDINHIGDRGVGNDSRRHLQRDSAFSCVPGGGLRIREASGRLGQREADGKTHRIGR